MAEKSHRRWRRSSPASRGSQMKKSAEKADQDMDSGKQCMSGRNRPGAIRAGKSASKSLRGLTAQMKQLQTEIGAGRMRPSTPRSSSWLAGEMVDLSERQEGIVGAAGRTNSRDLALEQDRSAGVRRIDRGRGL